jgi:DUF971 family protein
MSTHPTAPSPRRFPGGRPRAIHAPHGARSFEVSWPGPEPSITHAIPHSVLRGYCPCAGCQGHSGEIRYQAGGNEDLRDIEAVGRYALGLKWGDGHGTGIYSFEFLWRLGEFVRFHGPEGAIEVGLLPRDPSASA